jgi:hypothetical protein
MCRPSGGQHDILDRGSEVNVQARRLGCHQVDDVSKMHNAEWPTSSWMPVKAFTIAAISCERIHSTDLPV